MCWQCPSNPNDEAGVKSIRESSEHFARDLERLARHYRIAGSDSNARHNPAVLEETRPIAHHVLHVLFGDWGP
jgi:hypothetical protein